MILLMSPCSDNKRLQMIWALGIHVALAIGTHFEHVAWQSNISAFAGFCAYGREGWLGTGAPSDMNEKYQCTFKDLDMQYTLYPMSRLSKRWSCLCKREKALLAMQPVQRYAEPARPTGPKAGHRDRGRLCIRVAEEGEQVD